MFLFSFIQTLRYIQTEKHTSASNSIVTNLVFVLHPQQTVDWRTERASTNKWTNDQAWTIDFKVNSLVRLRSSSSVLSFNLFIFWTLKRNVIVCVWSPYAQLVSFKCSHCGISLWRKRIRIRSHTRFQQNG